MLLKPRFFSPYVMIPNTFFTGKLAIAPSKCDDTKSYEPGVSDADFSQ
jgi:hypothetical protein